MKPEDEKVFDEGLAKILQISTPDVKLFFDLHSKELKDLVDCIHAEFTGESPAVIEARKILAKYKPKDLT
jgi:hypothetical protein